MLCFEIKNKTKSEKNKEKICCKARENVLNSLLLNSFDKKEAIGEGLKINRVKAHGRV